jgi:hypothetical protein
VFEYSVECLQLDQALGAVVHLYRLEQSFSRADSLKSLTSSTFSSTRLTASMLDNSVWRGCLLSLVSCACNMGQLSWLCSSTTANCSTADSCQFSHEADVPVFDVESEIIKILEFLGASVGAVKESSFATSVSGAPLSTLSGLGYHECLTVYLINRRAYKQASMTMFAVMNRIAAECGNGGSNMLLLQLW